MNTALGRRRGKLSNLFAAQAAVVAPAAASEHEIADLQCFPVREPVSGRGYVVVRVKTRSGLTGFGECMQVSPEEVAKARHFWVGRPASSYVLMKPASSLDGAVDMALLDILGKVVKAPVHRVLGGPTRNKARALTSVSSTEQLDGAWSAGYRAFALRIPPPAARNQGQAYQMEVRQLADRLRKRGGDFVIDGAGLLTPGDAASAAATLQPLHPLWFDEPCSASNPQPIHKIADESVTPLGFGRGIAEAGVFQHLLREGLIDVVRPELAHFGITGSRRIAALAETYYVAAAPHHEGGPIATAAALHLAASLPNFFIQHIPYPGAEEDRRMRAEIAGSELERVKEGFAALPSGPGLGISVNESALEKYHAA